MSRTDYVVWKIDAGRCPGEISVKVRGEVARVLCAKNQRNRVAVYVEVHPDTSKVTELVLFRAHTGDRVDRKSWNYVGTVMLDDDSYVLHVYEKI